MNLTTPPKWILLAEDDPNDAESTLQGLSADQPSPDVIVTRDGAEALDCLHQRNGFQGRLDGNPVLALLDLKMPKRDGLEVLQEMKADPRLKRIPVVIFTSSREEADVMRSYDLGANSYVVKPVDFKQFISVIKDLKRFWLEINEPPPFRAGRNISNQTQLSAAAT